MEKDSELQQHLFKVFAKRHMLEFLRMEVRLNKRAKIKHLFKELGVNADLTFKKLFKPAIAKKVLLHYLDEVETNRSPLLNFKNIDDKAFLARIAFENPKITPKHAVLALGLKNALEAAPLRELKAMIGRNNPQAWYRLMKDIQDIRLPITQSSFKVVRDQLIEFKTVKIKC